EIPQELVHCRHHVWVRVESAAGEADVGWPIVAESFHQVRAPAQYADGQPASPGLAVGDEAGRDAKLLPRTADAQTKADEHLVENQDDAAAGTDLAQSRQPSSVGCSVELMAAGATDQGRVGQRERVRMQRLQWIDEHAG